MISNNQGFTLMEFVVATLILTVGLLGMLSAVNTATKHNLGNVLRAEAVTLGDDEIMNVRSRAFASISTNLSNPPDPAKDKVPPFVTKTRNVRGVMKDFSVQRYVKQQVTQSKEVIVTVRWVQNNKTYSHSVSSVVSTFPQ